MKIRHCTSTIRNDFNHYCEEPKERFVSQCYEPQLINKHMKAVAKMDRNKLWKERDNSTSKETKIILVLKCSWSLLNISKVFRKHWIIFSVNEAFKETFQNKPVKAFRSEKILMELIGSKKIKHSKLKKYNIIMKKGKCTRVKQIIRHFVAIRWFLHQLLIASRAVNLR